MRRSFRTVALITSALLIMGVAGSIPAEAKKKKKKAAPPACATYHSSGVGADAPLSVVTDAATEAAPVEVTVATPPGLGFSSADPEAGTGPVDYSYISVQVDSSAATANLFVKASWAIPLYDYDLFLRPGGGVASAYAAGFNFAPVGPLDGTGNGGHSEMGAEFIDGAVSLDCTGYTVEVTSAGTPGGDVTLSFWLG